MAPLLREDHTLHPVGRQSGTQFDNGFAVSSIPAKNARKRQGGWVSGSEGV